MSDLDQQIFYKADSLGYLADQGTAPIADPELPNHLNLLHTTVAPPFHTTSEEIFNGSEQGHGTTIPGLDRFVGLLELQDQLHVVRTADDLEAAFFAGDTLKTAVVMGLHEPPSDATPEVMNKLFNSGVRVTGLANGRPNNFGAGFHDNETGLTIAGRRYIEMANEAGMILDLSHSGHKTAEDALEFIRDSGLEIPVMASHGGVHEAYDGDKNSANNGRNLPSDVLSGIAEMDGVVGVYSLTFSLSDSDDSLEPFLTHLGAAVDSCGADHVVLGTDGVYKLRDVDEWREHFGYMKDKLSIPGVLEPRWPDTPVELNGTDKIEKLAVTLLAEGYEEEQVRSIAGVALVEYFSENLPQSDSA